MAFQDFTTYTEVDPNSAIAVAANTITSTVDSDETAYVYKDFGVDHFAGDFEHLVGVKCNSELLNNTFSQFWMLANDVEDSFASFSNGHSHIAVGVRDDIEEIRLQECDSGSVYLDTFRLTVGTQYYLTIKRDETAGTYGTMYVYIFTDAARTTLADTLTVALHTSKKDFRYLFSVNTWDNSIGGRATDITITNLDLQEATASLFLYPFASSFGLGGSGRFGVQES